MSGLVRCGYTEGAWRRAGRARGRGTGCSGGGAGTGASWCMAGQYSLSRPLHHHHHHYYFHHYHCRCRNGRLHGRCWKFLPGGGALYGNVGVDDKISGEDVVYLYPDFLTAIKVIVSQSISRLSGFFRECSEMRDSCPVSGSEHPRHSSPRDTSSTSTSLLFGTTPRFSPSDPRHKRSWPRNR